MKWLTIRRSLIGCLLFYFITTLTLCTGEETAPQDPPVIDGKSTIRNPFTETEQEQLKTGAETHQYQAEVHRLMDIIINSLYTDKDVFLRELISNAADALEKARFLSVTDSSYIEVNPEFDIRIEADKEAKTITIQDSGVGMTKQELINNLGTVARSGTTNFLEALSSGMDLNLIGQFGVGFYSAFLVADKVTVISKSHSDPTQNVWESTADASFIVAQDPRGNTLKRGTRIVLHLKDDSVQFLEEEKLKTIIKKFNQYMNFPIYLRVEKKPKEMTDEEKKEEDKRKDAMSIEELEAFEEEKRNPKKILEWEHVNKLKPIWLRPKEELNETDYNDFFIVGLRDYFNPLAYTHFSTEGEVEFKSILFLPKHPPLDDWSQFFHQKQTSIRLYARRVLVADNFYELMPRWLSFVKGVVDSDDLPLKVDRESLSQTNMMKVIGKKLVAKTLELIRRLHKEDKEEWNKYREDIKGDPTANITTPETKWEKFWKAFSKNMKLGCMEDEEHRDKIANLFKWRTTKTGINETITLDDYLDRMPEEQKEILFVAHDDYNAAIVSPHIKMFMKRGWEIIVAHDPLDEGCLQKISTFRTKSISSVEKTHTELGLTKQEKRRYKKLDKIYKPLIKFLEKHLLSKIGRVQVSQRLVDDAAAITTDPYAQGYYADRIIKSQSFATYHSDSQNPYRVLEVNPNHPLIKRMLEIVEADEEDPQALVLGNLLLETAMLGSGFTIISPANLTAKLVSVLRQDAGVPVDALVEDYPVEDDGEDVPDEDDDEYNSGTSSATSAPLSTDDIFTSAKPQDTEEGAEEEFKGVDGGAKDVEAEDGTPLRDEL